MEQLRPPDLRVKIGSLVLMQSFHCVMRTFGASQMGLAKPTVGELITVVAIIRTFHSLGCSDELRAKNTSLIMQLK